jgi:hypothetical protein
MVQISWLVLGLVVVVASARAQHSQRAFQVAVGAVGVLFVGAGAALNLGYLLLGRSYSGFAADSPIPFVRSTWESLVVPNTTFFIGLLVVFEATVGVLVVRGGRGRTIGLGAIAAFTVTLLSFSWWYLLWAVPIVAAMVLLHRADVRWSVDTAGQRALSLQD